MVLKRGGIGKMELGAQFFVAFYENEFYQWLNKKIYIPALYNKIF